MQRIKLFIPWFPWFTLIGFSYLIVKSDLKSILEILMLSATVGGAVGVLMGAIAAAVQNSVKVGIYILAGSVIGCFLFIFGLFGFVVVLGLANNVLLQSGGISTSSSSDTPPGAAEAVAETIGAVLFSILLIPGALLGGAIGADLYYDRYQHRE